jgi:protein required for attachment to host cells
MNAQILASILAQNQRIVAQNERILQMMDIGSTTTSETSCSVSEMDDSASISTVSTTRSSQKSSKRKPVELVIFEEKDAYSPEEVEQLDDYVLASEFERIVGCDKLSCKHCHGQKPIAFWIRSIRKRCMKKAGLCRTMTVPKTCDHQQSVNSICNVVNNKVYRTLRNPNVSEEEKERIKESKKELFEKISKKTMPYKY